MGSQTNLKGQDAVASRMTSDYSNCSGQRRDKQDPLSRDSRTVKTRRTCLAFRASRLFSRAAYTCRAKYCSVAAVVSVARPFLDVIDDCHDDARVTHRADKFMRTRPKKRINCRPAAWPVTSVARTSALGKSDRTV